MSDWNEAIKNTAIDLAKIVNAGIEYAERTGGTFHLDAEKLATELHRSLKRPAPLDGWMPIESAPKDGTHILVFVSDGYCVEAWWDSKQMNFYKSHEGWASYDPENMQGDWVSHFSDHGTKDARMYCGSTPNFWRALDNPPEEDR